MEIQKIFKHYQLTSTPEHIKSKQCPGILSGIGGWAGAVVAIPDLAAARGELHLIVGGYRKLLNSSRNSGVLMVFSLP